VDVHTSGYLNVLELWSMLGLGTGDSAPLAHHSQNTLVDTDTGTEKLTCFHDHVFFFFKTLNRGHHVAALCWLATFTSLQLAVYFHFRGGS